MLSYPVLGQRHECWADSLFSPLFCDADAANAAKTHGLQQRVGLIHHADTYKTKEFTGFFRDESDRGVLANAIEPVRGISIRFTRAGKNVWEGPVM
jgi:hypothetical protein